MEQHENGSRLYAASRIRGILVAEDKINEQHAEEVWKLRLGHTPINNAPASPRVHDVYHGRPGMSPRDRRCLPEPFSPAANVAIPNSARRAHAERVAAEAEKRRRERYGASWYACSHTAYKASEAHKKRMSETKVRRRLAKGARGRW